MPTKPTPKPKNPSVDKAKSASKAAANKSFNAAQAAHYQSIGGLNAKGAFVPLISQKAQDQLVRNASLQKSKADVAHEAYVNAVKNARTTVGDMRNVNPMNGPIAGSHKAIGK